MKHLHVTRVAAFAAVIVVASLMIVESANAQARTRDFPAGKPITLMVPYAAGGSTDAAGRFLAPGLEEALLTKIIIVNKPGAASQIALQGLLNSAPDGYTLSYAALPTFLSHYLDPGRDAPYSRKDFQPVALQFIVPNMLAVEASSPYKTLKDFVEAARANPGKLPISDSGLMSHTHLTALMLERAAGVRFRSVHFEGGAPAVTALLGGHVTALATAISDVLPHFQAGKLRVLGIAAEQESEFMPRVTTMKSQGYDVVMGAATGILAPGGTSKEVVEILTAAIKKVVESDVHKKRLNDLGVSPHYLNPAEYAALWATYESQVGPLLKEVRGSQSK